MWIIKKLFSVLGKFLWFLIRPVVWALVVFVIAWALRSVLLADVLDYIREMTGWAF